jgi:hypothetical protein
MTVLLSTAMARGADVALLMAAVMNSGNVPFFSFVIVITPLEGIDNDGCATRTLADLLGNCDEADPENKPSLAVNVIPGEPGADLLIVL